MHEHHLKAHPIDHGLIDSAQSGYVVTDLLDEIELALRARPHRFDVEQTDVGIVLRGTLCLYDDSGIYDEYRVSIGIPERYPWSEPIVKEVDGRIPAGLDRHNPDGWACICVWENWLALSPDVSFASYLDGPLSEYFLSQSYFEIHGAWPFNEEAHGVSGVFEAYSRALSLPENSTPDLLRRYLLLLARGEVKSRWPCPCGSGVRLKDCHIESVMTLSSRISPKLAKQMLKRLISMQRRVAALD